MASPAIGSSTAIVTTFQDPTTTGSITTTGSGSSFFVLFCSGSGATVTSVTDSKSNTYTLLGSSTNTNDGIKIWVYYAENGTGGASHTFTVDMSGNSLMVAGIEVTGAATASIIDASNTAYDTGGTPFNCSVTSTVDDTLFLGFVLASTTTGTWTANGGFTLGETAVNGTAAFRTAWAYKQVAGASANDPAWTSSNGVNDIAMVGCAVKPAAAAAGQPTMRRLGGVPGATPGGGFGRSWKESACGFLIPERAFA